MLAGSTPQDATILTIQTSIQLLSETMKAMQEQIASLIASGTNSLHTSVEFNSTVGTNSVGQGASAGTTANAFSGYTLESAFRQHSQGVAMEDGVQG